jgi:flagellar basal body-associated protein FliL
MTVDRSISDSLNSVRVSNLNSGVWTKKFTSGAILIMFLMSVILLSGMVMVGFGSRTGDTGNEPTTGFSEGNETVEIYHDDGEHNTTFAADENVNIRITSDIVNLNVDGPGKRNSIVLYDYLGGIQYSNIINAFTQQSSSSPYVYTGSFSAPSNPDHYLLGVELRDAPPDRNNLRTYDVIQVGSGASPPKRIITYSDPAATVQESVFGSGQIVYLGVYTSGNIDTGNSEITFADYFRNEVTLNLDELSNQTINKIGNDSIIVLDLAKDLDLTQDQFINNALQGNYWYTISVNLEDTNTNPMAVYWTAQIKILPPPVVTETYCDPKSIVAEGSETTTIYADFSDADASGINDFTITIKVRDPNNDEHILVDGLTNGNGGLTVNALTGNNYRLSYSWNPPDGSLLGNYDLYVEVSDSKSGLSMDDFDNNRGELLLTRAGLAPVIAIGNGTCVPSKVNVVNNDQVLLRVNFSDTNDPALAEDEFIITIRVRDSSNNEITIVNNRNDGQNGDAIGTGVVSVINYAIDYYTAQIFWNPAVTVPIGMYDLLFSISTIYGTATDSFGNNNDELELYSTGSPPDINNGDTSCLPTSVDIISNYQTMIYCEFIDPDNPEPSVFNVSFKVRPPNNRDSDVIVLVDNKGNGGAGEFGGTVSVSRSGTNYMASYNWDPPETADLGDYDLYCSVKDEFDNTAEDGFNRNSDELELISSVIPPQIVVGNTLCIPSSVNKVGSGTTKIFSEFTDSNFTSVDDFNVSFKVRDPDNNEIVLVDSKPSGSSGEDVNQTGVVEITYSGTVFTASYSWDPPLTITPGKYDLYFDVMNKAHGYAKDVFDNNVDELTVETSGNTPEITRVDCFPPTISIEGTETTSIYAEFNDADNPLVGNFSVTVQVRDPNGITIVLVDNKAHGGAGELGGTMEVTVSGNGYLASYDWDPTPAVQVGDYDLSFSIIDETLAEVHDGFDRNLDELTLTTGGDGTEPSDPSLAGGSYTKQDDVYNFTVTYIDPDNDPPNNDGVIIVVNGVNNKMIESDPGDTDYTNGKEYYYPSKLDDGDYDYYFKVTNSDSELNQTDTGSLTVESDEPKTKDETNYGLIVAAIVIVIVILLLLMLMMRKKKEPETESSRDDIASDWRILEETEDKGTAEAEESTEGEGEATEEGAGEDKTTEPEEGSEESPEGSDEEPKADSEPESKPPETEGEDAAEPEDKPDEPKPEEESKPPQAEEAKSESGENSTAPVAKNVGEEKKD